MPNTITKIIAGIVVALTVALLIGNRLGYSIAGGAGASPTQEFVLVETAGDFRAYTLGDNTLFLDANSDVELLNNHQGSETLRFLTGRMIAKGDVTLTARDVRVTVHGTATLVHYSWMDKMDVLVLDGTADVRQGSFTSTVTQGNAVSIDTLAPYDAIAPTTINIGASNVASFYEWALKQ